MGIMSGAQAQIVTLPSIMPGSGSGGGATSGGGGTYSASTLTAAPGTVIIRLGGQMYFYAAVTNDSGHKVTVPSTVTNGLGGQSFKESSFGFYDYARLYPSIDGVAANGLQYGALIEIRHEKDSAAGVTAGTANAGSSPSADEQSRGMLYVRREYAYFGLPQFGTIRLGSTDGPSYLFETGTFENVGDGMWNGSLPNSFDQNIEVTWPFTGVGNYYTLTRAVYLSPSFGGFEFGASYAPTASNANDYGGGFCAQGTTAYACNNNIYANPGSDLLSSGSTAATQSRLTNLVDVVGRYRGAIGPVGVAVQVGWIGSSHVNADGTQGASLNRFNGINVGDFGATATLAGITVGGHFTGGAQNGSFSLKPVGAVNTIAYLGGISYAFGPALVGASFFQNNFAGSSGPPPIATSIGQERDRGIAVGGNYSIAPGVSVFFSYLYGDRKENGEDFLFGNGSVDPTGALHNVVTMQGFAVGTNIRW
jgi:hypothetical protein